MTEKVTVSEKEYYEKLRKGKEIDRNTLIWVISFLLSFVLIVVGVIDWLADYQRINTSGQYVDVYTSSNGNVDTKTLQPIFGGVFARRQNGGFLPDFINLSVHDWIVISMIVLVTIPAVFIYQREGRRLAKIDENLPFLLREIADSQRIGMQLPRAIAEAAKRNYGPLTPELKKLAAKVSWGIPFRDAMMSFRDAVNTPLAKQATILILEAERSGGELEKIFESAQNYVEELLAIKQERESSIKPYIYIVFISYIIFAFVIYVLFTTFFAPFGVEEIQNSSGDDVIPIPLYAFQTVFLYLLISQGFFSGLVAGKMGHGTIKMGYLYSSILMIIGLLIHKVLINSAIIRIVMESQGG